MKKLTILALMLALAWGASAQFYMHVWYNDSVFTLPVLKVDSITFTDKWLEPGEPVDPEPETPSEGIITIDGDNTDWAVVPMLTEPGAAGPVVKMIIPQEGVGTTLPDDAAFVVMVEGDHEQILAGYPVIYVDADMSTQTGGSAWYCPIFGKDYELATWSEGTWFAQNEAGSIREMCLTKAAFTSVPFTGSLAAWLTFNWGALNIPAMPTDDGWLWSETKYHPFYVRPFSYAKLDTSHTAGDAYATHRALLPGESLQLSESGNDTALWVSWAVELKESATYNVSIDVTVTNMTSIDLWLVDPATNEVVAEFVGEDIEAPVGEIAYGTWDLSAVPAGKYMLKAKNHVQWANLVFHSVSFEIAGGGTTDEPSTPSEPEAPENTENGYEYVDLGLPSGLKWATCNVGANAPEEYGDYFAWGEVESKTTYNWSTYKWCNGSNNTLTKYNYKDGYGTLDNKMVLDKEDDAAAVNWGGAWRMPTKAEQDELLSNCTWTWTTQNGVNGYKVTGPSGNCIFLPAVGYRKESSLSRDGSNGNFWLSSIYEGLPDNAYGLFFDSEEHVWSIFYRFYGRPVRPVCDTPDDVLPSEPETPTQGVGVFSVAADKQVTFSQGNLQYTQSTNTWSFAENQWDMIGTDNVTGGSVSSDQYSGDRKDGDALADKVDLFGWSTATTNFGVSTSEDNADYDGDFVDWGSNQIGSDAPKTWRTLSYDEWRYLRYNRPYADNLVGVAQVNGVNGLILLPDNWTCPAGVSFEAGFHGESGVDYYAAYQTFTADQWSKLEAAGAVFLPASGERFGSGVDGVQNYGEYWSATEGYSYNAYYLFFYSDGAGTSTYSRDYGLSVRLVKDL